MIFAMALPSAYDINYLQSMTENKLMLNLRIVIITAITATITPSMCEFNPNVGSNTLSFFTWTSASADIMLKCRLD